MLKENVDLKPMTTFRIGGKARWFAEPESASELGELLNRAERQGMDLRILGGGSNLLVGEAGYEGLVVRLSRTGEFNSIEEAPDQPGCWKVGASAPLPLLVKTVLSAGWTGLEELAGIPGSVGGALVMNAGTASLGIGDFVHSVTLMDRSGTVRTVDRSELDFSYRHSGIGDALALWTELRFSQRVEAPDLLEQMRQRRARKAASQPIDMASAGCVFKNPPAGPAGLLLDRADCKGMREGGAEVSGLHANFIVNLGGATAMDVATLIGKMRCAVRERFSVELELEIKTWFLDAAETAVLSGETQ